MDKSELSRELFLNIISTRMAFRQTIQRVLKRNKIEITFEMLQVMHRLWLTEGVSQQFLAEKTAKDKACLTNLVNNLEKKGWVMRKENPADKRNRLVFLTEEGRELSDQIRPLLDGLYAQVTNKMSERQVQAGINHLLKLSKILDEI
ncbi:MarR family winged helix-turn-helix transcriptional regulator [Phocaeicola sp.]